MSVVPNWLKIGYTIWLLVWLPLYVAHYGPQNLLWFCDLGNIILGVALWTGSRLLFSWQAVSLLLVQAAWCVDLIGALAFGVHPIGGTEYMFDPRIPLDIRLLSLFHAAMPPLLLWGVFRFGYDRRALAVQIVTTWIVLPLSLLFGPALDINWVWGPFERPQTLLPPALYLALCMIAYPLFLYLPTHAILARLTARHRAWCSMPGAWSRPSE